ncbi:MAG: MerR family transcriptional regulator [Acidobacteriota bacterium]
MAEEPVVIPEKIYFKIGEVCELLDVQAHVLRYWETEFAVLSPQKNKSGQRSYRRRDVEIALRIKRLLYTEMFTIAGARKKLQQEAREGSKPKMVAAAPVPSAADESSPKANAKPAGRSTRAETPMLFDAGFKRPETQLEPPLPFEVTSQADGAKEDAMRALGVQLLELREMLKPKAPAVLSENR